MIKNLENILSGISFFFSFSSRTEKTLWRVRKLRVSYEVLICGVSNRSVLGFSVFFFKEGLLLLHTQLFWSLQFSAIRLDKKNNHFKLGVIFPLNIN